MPENSVKIILEAINKAEPAFEQLAKAIRAVGEESKKTEETTKKSTSSLGSIFETLKKNWLEFTATGASIFGMIKGIQSFVNETANAEQIESRMAFQIDAVGIKYKEVKIAIDAFANSIQNTTRFSSEMAQKGVGQMMQYTVDLGKAIEGTKLAMDMSTQTGWDLERCLLYVGMVMNGDVEVLGIMNSAFKHLSDNLGENATQAEKMEFGWKKLTEMYGGAAQQDLTTYAGKVTHLGNTWNEFKKIIGGQLIPVLDTALDRLTRMAKAGVITFGGGSEKERLEAQINTLEAELLALQSEQPYVSARAQEEVSAKIVAAKKRIIEIDKQQADAEKKVGEVSAEAVARKNWDEFVQGLHKLNQIAGETKIYITELQKTFNELNVTSQIDMVGMATAARTNMELIKKAVREGKDTWKDYENALKSATASAKAVVGEDPTKQLADLQKKYEETAKAISKDDPEFRKKIEALADAINEEMKKIQGPSVAELEADFREYNAKLNEQIEVVKAQLKANPLKPKIDASDMETLKPAYDQVKGEIESNPIKIQVDTSEINAAGGGVSSSVIDQQINYEFTGSGLSPEMPLGDAFDKIWENTDTLKQELAGLKFAFDFSDVNRAMGSIDQTLHKLKAVQDNWNWLISLSPYNRPETKIGGMGADLTRRLMDQMQEALDAKFKEQLGELTGYIEASGKSLTEDIWNKFTRGTSEEQGMKSWSQWNPKYTYESFKEMFPNYQTGTPYVPKTGPYWLHKGEEVRTTNQVAMNGMTINVNVPGAGNPKDVAEKIVKVLKYRLKGELKDLLR